MSYDAKVYKVFIASPGDVMTEREIAQSVIQQWNCNNSESKGVILQPVRWETNSYPSTGQSAQQELNDQCVNDCDFCIGIFWTKLGTPTDSHISLTVQEIELFIDSGKPAMIYFSDKSPANLKDIDFESYQKVKEYRADFENKHKGLYFSFSNEHDFQQNLSNHLQLIVNREFSGNSSQTNNHGGGNSEFSISDKARELLKEAANGSGKIGSLLGQGHNVLEITGVKDIISHNDNLPVREIAKWKDALQDLIKTGLIKALNPNNTAFEVTSKGFEYVDELKKRHSVDIKLSKEEKDILSKAISDDSGTIFSSPFGHFPPRIQIGNMELQIPHNRKSLLLYEKAIENLLQYGYISHSETESNPQLNVYKVTAEGYEYGRDNNLA